MSDPQLAAFEAAIANLMDLGVPRAITRSIEETMTSSGLTLGAPAYMSPEHARGGVEIDARADLHSDALSTLGTRAGVH